jgi:hypothetical protein
MTSSTELTRLVDSIIKGASRPMQDVTLSDFIAIYDTVLKRADSDHADVVISLAEGRAWARFPQLSRQILAIRERRALRREDFVLTSPAKVTVFGGDRQTGWLLFRQDLRDAWRLLALLASLAVLAAVISDVSALVAAVAPLLALASSLFFTVFVLFGIGEVIRSSSLQARVFQTGQLQRYLDADRYLVRLAVASFVFAITTLALEESDIVSKVLAALGADLLVRLSAVPVAILTLTLYLSGATIALCLRAATGYLLDRAAGTVLIELGTTAIEPYPEASEAQSDSRQSATAQR